MEIFDRPLEFLSQHVQNIKEASSISTLIEWVNKVFPCLAKVANYIFTLSTIYMHVDCKREIPFYPGLQLSHINYCSDSRVGGL